MSLLQSYWWAILVGTAVVVWAWRAWHRANRPPAPVSEAPLWGLPRPAPFRRSEFEGKAETVRREMAKGIKISLGIFLLGFPTLFAVTRLIPTLPRDVFSTGLIALLAAMVSSILALAIRDLVLEAGKCPGCGAQLLDPGEAP